MPGAVFEEESIYKLITPPAQPVAKPPRYKSKVRVCKLPPVRPTVMGVAPPASLIIVRLCGKSKGTGGWGDRGAEVRAGRGCS